MNLIKNTKKFKANKSILKIFLNKYWFIPSDVLQRGIEASMWEKFSFKRPILSIGIGNGELDSILFKKQGIMEVGIDLIEDQLESARELGIYKEVFSVNAEKMPFKNSTFSTIVSNSTFEHIRYDKKAVAECSRVLKKNGLFFMTTPSNYLSEWILSVETKRNKKVARHKLEEFNARAGHFHYHSLEEWEKILESNNLKIVFHKYYFPNEVAVYWYKLFKIFTFQIKHREIWSYLGHSKFTKVLPKKVIVKLLDEVFLQKYIKKAFIRDASVGAQHFIVAVKT